MCITGLIVIAIILGSDAFSAGVGIGMTGANRRQRLRCAIGFAVVGTIMPITGMIAGGRLGHMMLNLSAYIGGGMLMGLGFLTFLSKGGKEWSPAAINRSLPAFIAASFGTSLDNLAVGFTLGVLRAQMLTAVGMIGAATFLMTLVGLEIGARLGRSLEGRSSRVGGVVMMLIGLKIMLFP